MYPDLDFARVNSMKPNWMGLLGRNCLKSSLPLSLIIVSSIEISLERIKFCWNWQCSSCTTGLILNNRLHSSSCGGVELLSTKCKKCKMLANHCLSMVFPKEGVKVFLFPPNKQRSTVFVQVPLQNISQAMCGTHRLSAPSNEGPHPDTVFPAERIYYFRGQSSDCVVLVICSVGEV